MTGGIDAVFRIAAVCLFDSAGALLVVRKRGTAAFMLPGGKIERGETPRAAACREVREEIGCRLSPRTLRRLGVFDAPAANEAGRAIHAHVFDGRGIDAAFARPDAEIASLHWLRLDRAPDVFLAPLLRDHVIPALVSTAPASKPTGQ